MKSLLDWIGRAAFESTLTSSLLALMFGGAVCYCSIQQIPIPDILIHSVTAIITFFFVVKLKNDQPKDT